MSALLLLDEGKKLPSVNLMVVNALCGEMAERSKAPD